MRGRRAGWLLKAVAPALLVAVAGGCAGPTWYAAQSASASAKVEEAKALEAEKLAPYEYYLADEHLKKAAEEAASASYGDAIELADEAEAYATKAVERAKAARRGAGR